MSRPLRKRNGEWARASLERLIRWGLQALAGSPYHNIANEISFSSSGLCIQAV